VELAAATVFPEVRLFMARVAVPVQKTQSVAPVQAAAVAAALVGPRPAVRLLEMASRVWQIVDVAVALAVVEMEALALKPVATAAPVSSSSVYRHRRNGWR
jgi:hypothetical protein